MDCLPGWLAHASRYGVAVGLDKLGKFQPEYPELFRALSHTYTSSLWVRRQVLEELLFGAGPGADSHAAGLTPALATVISCSFGGLPSLRNLSLDIAQSPACNQASVND